MYRKLEIWRDSIDLLKTKRINALRRKLSEENDE